MATYENRTGQTRGWRQVLIILGTFIPIWTVVLLAGWIVIATLMPIDHADVGQIAVDSEAMPILDYMPASGPSDLPPKISN